MKRKIGNVLIGVLLALRAVTAFADLEATVDHTQVSANDLVTLTVRLSNQSANGSPDFSGLQRDFDVVQQSGPNQSSEFTFINGHQNSESHTDWTLTLAPKHTGRLIIPSIHLGNEATRPITIDVVQGSAQQQMPRADQPVFFETSVDHDTTWVQGQIIYTVKLYYTNAISGNFPAAPSIDNAVVETVDKEKRYESIVGGRRFYVLEKSYAIYPQQSGTMVIPRQRFNGTEGSNSFFAPSQPVTAVSRTHTIQVKPRPASFKGVNWLPAKALTLTESWGKRPPEFKVGEPINRILTITAKGVASSLLPPFPALHLKNAKTYADPANTTDQPNPRDGIVSTESTTIGIVPTRPGKLTLPEVRIPWFNTTTNRMEVAAIPAETYTIAAAPGSSVTMPQQPPAPVATPAANTGTATQIVTYVPSRVWLYVLAAIALLWLLSTWQWWSTRRRLHALMNQLQPDQPPADLSIGEGDAWSLFQRACKTNDASRASKTLFVWATTRYPNIRTLADLGRLGGEDLSDAIHELDDALYSPQGQHTWQSARLLAAAKTLHDRKADKPKHTALTATLNPA